MCPNEGHTHKSAKHEAALPEKHPSRGKNETEDLPGVSGVPMPPEKEMSPPQLG